MHVITGGTGRVGSALANELLQKGEEVTIISRSSKDAKEWIEKGARIAVADIYDTAALHEIFKTGKSIFILNPPADPMTDTTLQETKTADSMLKALKDSGVEKVVVESSMGATPGDNNGDSGVLYELEQGIKNLSYPYSIIRPAYYMSNWIEALPMIEQTGELISFYPADLKFPMVAPADIAQVASRLMTEKNSPELIWIQGPEMYSANDVAAVLSKALGKEIIVKVIPQDQWRETYQSMGFSKKAADSYSNMTEEALDAFKQGKLDAKGMIHGKTTLDDFIESSLKHNTSSS